MQSKRQKGRARPRRADGEATGHTGRAVERGTHQPHANQRLVDTKRAPPPCLAPPAPIRGQQQQQQQDRETHANLVLRPDATTSAPAREVWAGGSEEVGRGK